MTHFSQTNRIPSAQQAVADNTEVPFANRVFANQCVRVFVCLIFCSCILTKTTVSKETQKKERGPKRRDECIVKYNEPKKCLTEIGVVR
jgi:hypothetical protein